MSQEQTQVNLYAVIGKLYVRGELLADQLQWSLNELNKKDEPKEEQE